MSSDRFVWEFYGKVTQINAGATTVSIKVAPGIGNVLELLSLRVGTDDYAAGRTISVIVLDEDGNAVQLLDEASIDNQILFSNRRSTHATDTTASTVLAIGGTPDKPIIAGYDTLNVQGASLAQNETVTTRIRALVTSLPTVSAVGSNATLTTSDNRIVGHYRN